MSVKEKMRRKKEREGVDSTEKERAGTILELQPSSEEREILVRENGNSRVQRNGGWTERVDPMENLLPYETWP